MAKPRNTPRVPLADQAHDVCETHFGRWMTIAEIAVRLGCNPDSLARALLRRLPEGMERRVDPDHGEFLFRVQERSYLNDPAYFEDNLAATS